MKSVSKCKFGRPLIFLCRLLPILPPAKAVGPVTRIACLPTPNPVTTQQEIPYFEQAVWNYDTSPTQPEHIGE